MRTIKEKNDATQFFITTKEGDKKFSIYANYPYGKKYLNAPLNFQGVHIGPLGMTFENKTVFKLEEEGNCSNDIDIYSEWVHSNNFLYIYTETRYRKKRGYITVRGDFITCVPSIEVQNKKNLLFKLVRPPPVDKNEQIPTSSECI